MTADTMTLARLVSAYRMDLIGLHDLDDPVPVATGFDPVAQGDVPVVPLIGRTADEWTGWATVPSGGGAVVVAGEHDHRVCGDGVRVLAGIRVLADPRTSELAVALVAVPDGGTAWLLHDEHGGQGLPAGVWEVRRQRDARGAVAD